MHANGSKNKDEKIKKQVIRLIKIFTFIILPFIYGYYILPHQQTLIDVDFYSPTPANANNSLTQQNGEGIVTAPTKIATIFPLAGYLNFWPLTIVENPQICFQDRGSKILVGNKTSEENHISWNIKFSGRNDTIMNEGESQCVDVKIGEKFNYRWDAKLKVTIPRNETNSMITIVPDTKTYSQFQMNYGLLQAISLISAGYLFIWYPAIEIWKQIKQ
ncbi:hypothetical protein HY990_01265 [Candidatus Micrarchaeota archaeon]|nr:hypothetical protein [Candidatus Micrarchaeota archaeon]